MHRVTKEEYPLDSLQRILNGVTFFKELIHQDESQFEVLMSIAQIVTAESNETIIEKGDYSNSLYFLLRGQLSVYVEEEQGEHALNEINAGEVFGVMSMLLNQPRSASIRTGDKTALLASIDFKHFSNIEDFSMFSLETKLTFYRMVANNLRWTLERNKIENSAHPLIPRLYKIPLFNGQKGGSDELEALFKQSHLLAELVSEWNDS
ncbi:MAG: cyclic nucleotide-binding domain-containing protein [Oleispira antarctica]|nr:cyclic nucleotide-binding domain-containing protein [Oleispira antarctica]MBQ0791886.1 cyclic nucleotide-binding domain-containing protein [Oleispira antarctica]